MESTQGQELGRINRFAIGINSGELEHEEADKQCVQSVLGGAPRDFVRSASVGGAVELFALKKGALCRR